MGFPVTVNGHIYYEGDFTGYGYQTALPNMIADTAAVAGQASTNATNAANSANSALNAPGTNATSTTSLTVGTGSQNLTIQTGKAFAVGQTVVIAYTTTPTTRMLGTITAHNSGTGALTVDVTDINGSGTQAAWTVSLSATNNTLPSQGALINSATAKTMPVDADMVGLMDSAASNILKKLSWANIKAALLGTVNTWTKTQTAAVTALTSSAGSIAVDLSLSNNFSHTMTENTTLAAPSNAVAGTSGQIAFTQHASAAKTLAFNAAWIAASGTAGVISTTLSAVNVMSYYVVDSTHIWYSWNKAGVA